MSFTLSALLLMAIYILLVFIADGAYQVQCVKPPNRWQHSGKSANILFLLKSNSFMPKWSEPSSKERLKWPQHHPDQKLK